MLRPTDTELPQRLASPTHIPTYLHTHMYDHGGGGKGIFTELVRST